MYSLFNKNVFGLLVGFIFLVSMVYAASPANVNLGTAQDYIILAKSGISTTGTTFVNGDIGVSPIDSTAITGFGALPLDPTGQFSTSVLVSGKIYAGDYASPTPTKLGVAIGDMQTAYTDALSRPTSVLNAGDGAGEIGGLTLVPGVYTFTGGSINVLISTDLTLNGTSSDVWIFQIPGTFNLANNKKVNLIGGAIAKNIFWVVTGATTLGTDSVLEGTILDATNIAIQTNATLNGNALAQTAVTLQSNSINDTTLPIITRNGFIDVNVDFNSIYVDNYATAYDSVDGNLTNAIITFNDVNTLLVGTYVVTYNVTDLSGNNAVEVIRNVNVIDSNKPLITLNGSDINVQINSTYIDTGATAYDVVDGNLTSSIVTFNDVNTSLIGTYVVTYDVNDLSGNKAIQVIRNVNVVDTNLGDITPPVIDNVVDKVKEATSPNGAIATFVVPMSHDSVDGNLISTCDRNSGSTFALGVTTVTCSKTDVAGNIAIPETFTVTVNDTKGPVLSQMYYSGANAPDSYRGITISTVFPYPITTTSGLILIRGLTLGSSDIDVGSGTEYCKFNFDYAADNNNWGPQLSWAQTKYVSFRYTTTGAKVIAVFCKDKADNNSILLSSSVPFYHVTVVDTNYPANTVLLTANPDLINLNKDYNLIYFAPDGNALKSLVFNVNGINYSFDINAIKNEDGTFYATITPDSNRMSGLVNVIAKVTDNSNSVEYISNDFNSVKDATLISLTASNLTQTSVSLDLNSNNLVDVQLRKDVNWDDFVADFNNKTILVWDLNELSPSTAYTYYVLSLDENQNKIVNTISFTTLAVEVVTTGGGRGTVGGPRVIPTVVIPEVETGPTIPDTTDNTNTNGNDSELDVTNTDGTDTNPATGAFGLTGNDNNSQASPTGLFGFGSINPFWVWLLLLIPAAMFIVASQRIKTQREEAEDEKKRKRDEELAKRSNKK